MSIGLAATPPLPMPSMITDAVPVVDDGKTDVKAELTAAVTQPNVKNIRELA